MGKDLKGKECGKGICQRKDGLYSARYTVNGKTRYSYFKTVKDAKAWLKEEKDMFYDRRRKFYWVLSRVR